MVPNVNRKKHDESLELYSKLKKLDPLKLQILDARIDQMLLDQEEILDLRAKLELANAIIESTKTA